MEEHIRTVVEYATRLVTERWPELVIGLALVGLWRWFMGHNLRTRIKTLETKAATPRIVIEAGGTYNHYESVDNLHYRIEGSAEVIQPKPRTGRTIPLQIDFAEGIAISDNSEATLIGPDSNVKMSEK